jgi:hypothetical protein
MSRPILLMCLLLVVACGDDASSGASDAEGGAGGVSDTDSSGGVKGGGTPLGGTAQHGGVPGDTAGQSSGIAGATAAGAPGAGGAPSGGEAGTGPTEAGAGSGAGGEAGAAPTAAGCATDAEGPVVGGTRLKARCIAASDGAQILLRGRLFDSDLGVDCAYRTAADGMLRCLPTVGSRTLDGWGRTFYTDDQCENGFVLVEKGPAGCTQHVPTYVYHSEPSPLCSQTTHDAAAIPLHIYPVGALLEPPGQRYARNGLGVCGPAQGGPGGIFVAYQLGAELPAQGFVAGTRSEEP